LIICAVRVGAFVGQFVQGEFSSPLCVLQHMAMMLCALLIFLGEMITASLNLKFAREPSPKARSSLTGYRGCALAVGCDHRRERGRGLC